MASQKLPSVPPSAKDIFPIFGELHAGDSVPSEPPREQVHRKAYTNDAGLFIVTKGLADLTAQLEEPEREPLTVTLDLAADTAAALECLAFLVEFFNCLEPADFRRIVDQIRRATNGY